MRASCAVDGDGVVHCVIAFGDTHLLVKKACSAALSVAQENAFSLVPAVPSKVQSARVSLLAPTLESSWPSACHWIAALTLPVAGSMVCANILPDQVLVS